MSAEATVSIRRAAELAACDPSTIKRDLLDGRYPGAARDDSDRNRAWRIPVRDLVLAGRYRVPDRQERNAAGELDRELAWAREQLRSEQEAHADTAARLAAAQATLDAERRHALTLERLVERALGAGRGVA